jgi:HK97 family phage major capsid protein
VSTAARLATEAQGIFDAADQQNRALTGDERTYVEGLLKRVEERQDFESRVKGLTPEQEKFFGTAGARLNAARNDGGPGDAFVQSAGWKSISDPSTRGQQWTTGAVDVGSMALTKAGTLFEGSGGQGAGLVPVPQVVPGIVSGLFQPLGVADLFSQAQATTSSVRYITEGTATNSAAAVAEGGTKPASDLAMSTIDEPVKKVATVLTVSDEILEDATAIQTYLNSRLSLFVTIEQERQLLRGTGTNELVGIFGRSGINTYTKAATDDNATALAKVLANTAGSSFLYPDAIVMHPTNWLNTRLLRDGTGGTAGQFLGGGPFTGAYGNGGAITPVSGAGRQLRRDAVERARRPVDGCRAGHGTGRFVPFGCADFPARRRDGRGD